MKVLLPCLLLAAAGLQAAPFEVHGHRGAMAVRPENTLPSFQEAIRACTAHRTRCVRDTR